MSDSFDLDITGIEDLERRMDAFGPEYSRRALRKGVIAGATVLKNAAKDNAPVMTTDRGEARTPGELRDSIDITMTDAHYASPSYEVATVSPTYNTADGQQSPGVWGKFVEYGSVHNPTPRPFLRPSIDEEGEAAIDACLKTMSEELDQMPEAPAVSAA